MRDRDNIVLIMIAGRIVSPQSNQHAEPFAELEHRDGRIDSVFFPLEPTFHRGQIFDCLEKGCGRSRPEMRGPGVRTSGASMTAVLRAGARRVR
ncbi:hypothetical protein ACIBCT_08535 [Streptosporangium sp. NPDC050855]|uniref:hypothetical protein n=1 Tax=Streptosporangium sp. NPDC050855 TaxID=3366194 RepID=UPI0037936275